MDTPTTEAETKVAALRASLLDDLLSYEQACEALGGISRYTLSKLVRDKKIVSVQIKNRRYIPAESLAAYIRAVRGERRPARPAIPATRTA